MMKRLRSSHFSQNRLVSAYLDHQCVELGIWRKHDNGYTEIVDFPKATELRIILVLRRTSARLTAFSFLFFLFFFTAFSIMLFLFIKWAPFLFEPSYSKWYLKKQSNGVCLGHFLSAWHKLASLRKYASFWHIFYINDWSGRFYSVDSCPWAGDTELSKKPGPPCLLHQSLLSDFCLDFFYLDYYLEIVWKTRPSTSYFLSYYLSQQDSVLRQWHQTNQTTIKPTS